MVRREHTIWTVVCIRDEVGLDHVIVFKELNILLHQVVSLADRSVIMSPVLIVGKGNLLCSQVE